MPAARHPMHHQKDVEDHLSEDARACCQGGTACVDLCGCALSRSPAGICCCRCMPKCMYVRTIRRNTAGVTRQRLTVTRAQRVHSHEASYHSQTNGEYLLSMPPLQTSQVGRVSSGLDDERAEKVVTEILFKPSTQAKKIRDSSHPRDLD